MNIDAALVERLEQRKQQQLYRDRLIVDSPQGREVIIDGQYYLSFCSNDYLGLANHPEVAADLRQAAQDFGVGSGASHLVSGHSRVHCQLEDELAQYTGRERALLFSSGYMANIGVIVALLGRGDTVLQDRLNHASLLDGGLVSRAKLVRYKHNDLSDLNFRLSQVQSGKKLIAVDGVFSMDGDIAPLDQLSSLADSAHAWLMVDDAHGLGVLGANGGGTTEHYGLSQADVPILMGTLGKAFGVSGAFVAGSSALIETLIQYARSYIYTTAMPSVLAAAILRSLKVARSESWRREKLNRLIERFRCGASQLGLSLLPSKTPIQPIVLGDAEKTVQAGKRLKEKGLLVGIIRPPTVPNGSARLRITLSAAHEMSDVDKLLDGLEGLADG